MPAWPPPKSSWGLCCGPSFSSSLFVLRGAQKSPRLPRRSLTPFLRFQYVAPAEQSGSSRCAERTTNFQGRLELEQRRLLHENAPRLGAEILDLRLFQLHLLARPRATDIEQFICAAYIEHERERGGSVRGRRPAGAQRRRRTGAPRPAPVQETVFAALKGVQHCSNESARRQEIRGRPHPSVPMMESTEGCTAMVRFESRRRGGPSWFDEW